MALWFSLFKHFPVLYQYVMDYENKYMKISQQVFVNYVILYVHLKVLYLLNN